MVNSKDMDLRVWLVSNNLPPRFSGAGINDASIAPHLADHGLNITFLASRYGKEPKLDAINGIKVFRAGQATGPFTPLCWLIDSLKFILITKKRPSVIRFRGYCFQFAGLIFFAKILFPGIKVIVQPACLGEDDPDTVSKKKLGRFQRIQMLKSDAMFAMNPVIGDILVANGFPSDRIFPVRNMVDVSKFLALNKEEKDKKKREIGLPNGLVIVTLGMLHSRKGQAFVTQAFCDYLKLNYSQDIALVHIGPTVRDLKQLSRLDRVATTREEEGRIETIAEEAGLKSQVLMIGNKANPAEYLAAADVFIHCSLYEGEANAVNEALASGLTVIIPDSDVYKAQVPDDCAMRFVTGDSRDLQRNLSVVIADESLRNKLGENARKHILQTRTAENVAEHYAGLFKKVYSSSVES